MNVADKNLSYFAENLRKKFFGCTPGRHQAGSGIEHQCPEDGAAMSKRNFFSIAFLPRRERCVPAKLNSLQQLNIDRTTFPT